MYDSSIRLNKYVWIMWACAWKWIQLYFVMMRFQRAFLTPSATTFHQMLGSSGSIKTWRKHQRVGEDIEEKRSKCSKYICKKEYGANNLCWAKNMVGCGVHPIFWVKCYNFGGITTKWHIKTDLVRFCRKFTSVEKLDFESKLNGKIASA